jgi:hypothetical protein
MSTPASRDNPRVLIVSDTDDASIRDCAASLTNAGAVVETAPDVYAAMAMLAVQSDIQAVLLDVRTLDDAEVAFQRLAARYYPAVAVMVPSLPGTARRISSYGSALRAVDEAAIVSSLERRFAPVDTDDTEAVAITQDPQAPAGTPDTLSTDGGPEAVGDTPAAHESVRQRMAGDDPREPRRTPPRRAPPRTVEPDNPPAPEVDSVSADGSPDSAAPPEPAALSPEEVDALLGEADEQEPGQTPSDDAEGAS